MSHVPPNGIAGLSRLDSVDLLRGLVMVVMALDHTRDYFHGAAIRGLDPTDLARTTPAVFFTRWITHYCAPTFCLLAGIGVLLAADRGRSRRDLSWFLVTRGGWLIFVELTLLYFVMTWTLPIHLTLALILWALGWSMILLAALIHLPVWAVAAFGLALILGHNAFDGVKPSDWGGWAWLWQVLHVPGVVRVTAGFNYVVGYPLIPWLGVMAAGYALGSVFRLDAFTRKKWLIGLGLGLIVAFGLLRFSNLYGDPRPWAVQSSPGFTVLSFLNCTKYPPSLCFLLMTLGPGILLLSLLNDRTPAVLQPVVTFGRVPFFYYVIHLALIHGLASLLSVVRPGQTVMAGPGAVNPSGAGVNLLTVYLIWLAVVVALYPACRWFAELKRRRRDRWLSYF